MYDDDYDALAAEYVLGTLSAAEREQAEALLARDAGFAETVRLWEHRLGELNVMVEAVEPPPDLWERVKTGIDGAERRTLVAFETVELTGMQFEPTEAAVPANGAPIEAAAEPAVQTVPDLLSEPAQASEEPKPADTADLASTLLASQSQAQLDDQVPSTAAPQTAAGAETPARDRNVGVWRGLAIAASVVAALLAAYIVAGQFAPGGSGSTVTLVPSAPSWPGSPLSPLSPCPFQEIAISESRQDALAGSITRSWPSIFW